MKWLIKIQEQSNMSKTTVIESLKIYTGRHKNLASMYNQNLHVFLRKVTALLMLDSLNSSRYSMPLKRATP